MQRWPQTVGLFTWLCGMGCGPLPGAQPYSGGTPLSTSPAPIPADAPTFVIEENYGIHIPIGSVGITTNQRVWSLVWIADGETRTYSGDVYAPTNGTLANLRGGDHSELVSGDHLHFDVVTSPNQQQQISFLTSLGPLAFVLSIAGQPTTPGQVVFASGKQLATVDATTFRLVSSRGPLP